LGQGGPPQVLAPRLGFLLFQSKTQDAQLAAPSSCPAKMLRLVIAISLLARSTLPLCSHSYLPRMTIRPCFQLKFLNGR
jgi:hypothetical protein